MIKKCTWLISLLLVTVMLCAAPVIAAPSVIVNGNQLSFDVPSVIANGRTLVPLRAIFESLGASLQWDGNNQTVTATKAGTTIIITIGQTIAYMNGSPVTLAAPAKVINNRTMVPVRFVSEALGAEVNWDGYTQTITIFSDSTYKDSPSYVRITTTGAAFSPLVELESGSKAMANWVVEGGETYTGLNPTIDFGSADTRYIRMYVTDGELNAIKDVVTFNVGFNHTQDAGKYNLGSGYNYPSQSVSNIQFVNNMINLNRFLAATPTLAGALDFAGMSKLEYIECYGAAVSSVTLTECTSLIRLCMEGNDLEALDLNPVAGNLRDLRMSGNRSPITLAPLSGPMARLYHYCAQGETVVNHPTAEQLPVVEEWWDYYSSQSGALVVRSSAIRNLDSCGNSWFSVDLTNQFPAGRKGKAILSNNKISSVILTSCNGLTSLDLQNNQLNQNAINALLTEIESWGTSNGYLDIRGNSAPSSEGRAKINLLVNRGWNIIYDSNKLP